MEFTATVAQAELVSKFIVSQTEAAKNANDASDYSAVKMAIIEYAGGQHLKFSDAQLQDSLAGWGIGQMSNGQKTVLTYKYPGTEITKAIKLKSVDDVAAA